MEKPLVLHYPIIHTEGEAGYKISDRVTMLDEVTQPLWRAIREDILARSLDYKKLNIYEDGMTIDDEKKPGGIVGSLARDCPRHSPNLEMLTFLISKGASLIGLEDDMLVMASVTHREYALAADRDGDKKAVRHHWQEFKRLVILRDKAIPERIRTTLPQDRTGVLFLGDGHNIKPHSRGLTLVTPPKVSEVARAVARRYSQLRAATSPNTS